MFRKKRKSVCVFILLCFTLCFFVGCTAQQIHDMTDDVSDVQSQVATIAQAVGQASYDDDETLNLLRALNAANAASAPVNPYALPIGAGLTGVIAVLEALRRKEQGGRKFAEHELRNGNGDKNGRA